MSTGIREMTLNNYLEQVGERLAMERKRLQFKRQDDFADAMKMAHRTYWDREKGVVSPDAEFFARFCEIGGDVMFVLTGARGWQPAVREPGAPDYKPALRLANEIASMALSDDDAALICGLAKRLSDNRS